MPTRDGGMSEKTRALWERLEDPVGPWRFLAWKIGGTSIGRARNIATAMALESDASKVLMLDADQWAGEDQLLRILGHAEPVVGGIYPRKEVAWPTRWCVNFSGALRPDGLRPATDIGAGFLRVDLEAIETIVKQNPQLRYLSDEEGTYGEQLFDLWSEGVATDSWSPGGPKFPRKLSEDFWFCWLARRAGFTVYADTLCQVGHVGAVDFLEVACLIQQLTGGAKAT